MMYSGEISKLFQEDCAKIVYKRKTGVDNEALRFLVNSLLYKDYKGDESTGTLQGFTEP